jgi:hypothetical protein
MSCAQLKPNCQDADYYHKRKLNFIKQRKPFKLVSYEHGTLLKVSTDGSLVAVESSPNLLQEKNVWFVSCNDGGNYQNDIDIYDARHNNTNNREQSFEICSEEYVEQKLVFNKVYKYFRMISIQKMSQEDYMFTNVVAIPYNQERAGSNNNVISDSNGVLLSIRPNSDDLVKQNMHILQVKTAKSLFRRSKNKFIKLGRLKMVKQQGRQQRTHRLYRTDNDVILELHFKE